MILFSSYRGSLVEHNPMGEQMLSFHSDINTKLGYIRRLMHIPKSHKFCENDLYIWSPWLVEFILKINGFGKIESKNPSGLQWITKARK